MCKHAPFLPLLKMVYILKKKKEGERLNNNVIWSKCMKIWACTYKDFGWDLNNWTKDTNAGHQTSWLLSHFSIKRWAVICLICGGPFVVGLTDNTPSSTLASSQSADASTWNSFQVRERNWQAMFRMFLDRHSWLFFPPFNSNPVLCFRLQIV